MRFGCFFNQKNTTRKTVQIINAAALTLAVYHYYNDPEANIFETGHDIAAHILTHFALQDNPNVFFSLASCTVNLTNIGSIFTGITSAATSIPLAENVADIFLHFGNVLTQIVTDDGSFQDYAEEIYEECYHQRHLM